MSTLLRLGLIAALVASTKSRAELPAVRDGDLIFHTSRSAQSVAIQRATHSAYSHMGVVFIRRGKPFVFEAISTVRFTPLEAWVERGTGGHFVLKRLKDSKRLLDPAGVDKLTAVAQTFRGRRYDLTFEWSDERIYCSELAWKIYDRALGVRIGALQKLRDFDLQDPVVRKKLKERYGSRLPLDEPVISPSAMFESDLLVTVGER